MTGCASILLAAGSSQRLGKPKQLLRIGGESLLRRTASFAVEAGCSPSFVVLGAFAEELRQELDGLAVEIVINPHWQEGMGSSLRIAMDRLLQRSPVPRAALLLVCDQPNVNADVLRTLVTRQAAGKSPIVACRYSGVAGVPAVFGSAFFSKLALVYGDTGARRILTEHAAETSYVDFPQGGLDVDTPADELLMKNWLS